MYQIVVMTLSNGLHGTFGLAGGFCILHVEVKDRLVSHLQNILSIVRYEVTR